MVYDEKPRASWELRTYVNWDTPWTYGSVAMFVVVCLTSRRRERFEACCNVLLCSLLHVVQWLHFFVAGSRLTLAFFCRILLHLVWSILYFFLIVSCIAFCCSWPFHAFCCGCNFFLFGSCCVLCSLQYFWYMLGRSSVAPGVFFFYFIVLSFISFYFIAYYVFFYYFISPDIYIFFVFWGVFGS